jgi:predicted AlkP superfamily phosphohydrolase/phosphomutase
MRKYQNLIDDLLKLDDSELNSLINSISKDPIAFEYGTEGEPIEAKELKKWLVMNGYINSVDQMNNTMMPYYSMFPTDVILLTRRISRFYPDWTNRKTLEEMKKFSVHVQNNLPVN